METPVLEPLFNEAAGLYVCNFLRKRPQHRCYNVIITKVLRIPILKNNFEWLFKRSVDIFELCHTIVSCICIAKYMCLLLKRSKEK